MKSLQRELEIQKKLLSDQLRGLNASEKLLKTAFESFSNYLSKKFQKTEELINFVDNLVNNIFFTVITVTDIMSYFVNTKNPQV